MFIFCSNKARLHERFVQGQAVPGHKILRNHINQNYSHFFLRLSLFYCQTISKFNFFQTLIAAFKTFWGISLCYLGEKKKATPGGIECSGKAEGFRMKGQCTEVARLTFTQPFFKPDHHRAWMTLKYSIDCAPSCACEKAWEALFTTHDILLLLFFVSLY